MTQVRRSRTRIIARGESSVQTVSVYIAIWLGRLLALLRRTARFVVCSKMQQPKRQWFASTPCRSTQRSQLQVDVSALRWAKGAVAALVTVGEKKFEVKIFPRHCAAAAMEKSSCHHAAQRSDERACVACHAITPKIQHACFVDRCCNGCRLLRPSELPDQPGAWQSTQWLATSSHALHATGQCDQARGASPDFASGLRLSRLRSPLAYASSKQPVPHSIGPAAMAQARST